MKPGGKLFIHCSVAPAHYGIYRELAKDERFAPFMKNVKDVTPSYHFAVDPVEAFRQNICASGMKIEHISVRTVEFKYQDESVFECESKHNCVTSLQFVYLLILPNESFHNANRVDSSTI